MPRTCSCGKRANWTAKQLRLAHKEHKKLLLQHFKCTFSAFSCCDVCGSKIVRCKIHNECTINLALEKGRLPKTWESSSCLEQNSVAILPEISPEITSNSTSSPSVVPTVTRNSSSTPTSPLALTFENECSQSVSSLSTSACPSLLNSTTSRSLRSCLLRKVNRAIPFLVELPDSPTKHSEVLETTF